MTRHRKFVEAGKHGEVEITQAEARWLIDRRLAAVSPSKVPGRFDLKMENVVGAIRFGDLQVTIRPKLEVGDAMNLIAYSRYIDEWQSDEADLEGAGFTVVLAGLYRRMLERALRYGIPQGYHNVDTSGPLLRGRIRIPDQLSRHHGRLVPFEMNYDEYGNDIAENRILLAASRVLLRALMAEVPGERTFNAARSQDPQKGPQPSSGQLREEIVRLRRLISLFRDVGALVEGRLLPDWTATRLNEHLVPALRLAELVLGGRGVDIQDGRIRGNGLLINMWRVFEAAVARAVKEGLPGYHVEAQYTKVISGGGLKVRPDLVILDGGHPVAVIDTKYKTCPDDHSLPRDDLFQAVTYATVFGLDEVTLLYAGPCQNRSIKISAGSDITASEKKDITVRFLGLNIPEIANGRLVDCLPLSLSARRKGQRQGS